MSMHCPPAPNYIRARGITDCEYLEMDPFVKRDLHEQFLSRRDCSSPTPPTQNSTYSIGGFMMRHSNMGATPRVYGMGATPRVYGMGATPRVYGMGATPRVYGMGATPRVYGMGATPRVYGMSHLGRTVLDVSKAQNYNRGGSSVKPSSVGSSGNTSSDSFIKDLWTAQVITLWVTDGKAFSDMGMSGIVTKNGHSPSNLSPLGIGADGIATTNLKSVLPSAGSSDTGVKGPDGMFGPSAESVIAEFAGTGKVFGKPISGNATLALSRLAQNVTTPQIKAARDARAAGNPPAPKDAPAKTPCSQLNPDARASRPDCPQPSGVPVGGGGGKSTPTPKTPSAPPAKAAEGDNTLLYAGIAGLAVVLGGVGYYVYSQKKADGAL